MSKVGDHSRGLPEGSLFNSYYTLGVGESATPFRRLLHHFLSLSYDSTWDWTPISRTSLEHSTLRPMVQWVKLAATVEGYPKAPFSIASALRCREGRYSIPWIAPLTLDPYIIILSAKQGSIKNHFLKVFVMTGPGIEARSPWPLVDIPLIRPMAQFTQYKEIKFINL